MSNQQFLQDIATALGGTLVMAKWHSDEPASEDRGYIFFGDPELWQTPSIFLSVGGWRKEGKVTVATNRLPRFVKDNGVLSELSNNLPYSYEAVMSMSKGAAACAKDIKRRVVDLMLAAHPAAVAQIESAITKENDRQAWLISVGIPEGRDRGDVWRGPNYARASIEHCYDNSVSMRLDSLTRMQAEGVIRALRGTESCTP